MNTASFFCIVHAVQIGAKGYMPAHTGRLTSAGTGTGWTQNVVHSFLVWV